ncbi:TetR/AcrR family transcriptional regulator [Pengzhenrongella sp.]|uniref:TetR/AcrR family transcriptional regulator n=1 Tax=Pengzhenrongella sp. TaxID=2888820 RepID=UPI002F91F200
MTAEPVLSRRERTRIATVDEIKSTALALMREQGTTDVRFTDIARVMGVTAPALYRYFDDRDELLTALIDDGFRSLERRIAEAREHVPDADIAGRWLAAANAYRDWARGEPQQFALVLGMPIPGYAAPEQGTTTEAAKGAMDQLATLFIAAAMQGGLGDPLIREVSPTVTECQLTKQGEKDWLISPESFQAMLLTWAMLHGFTSLEVHGHLDWLTPEARDALFLSQVRLAAKAAGLPVPPA